MRKRNLHLISLLYVILTIQSLPAFCQSSTVCSSFIRQKDTIICPGISVSLDLLNPPKNDTLLPGVWKLLIKGSSIDSILFNIKPFGYDKVNQFLYSIIHKKIIRFDLKANTISSIPANNWPDDYTEFTYDYTNKRLLCWRGGRDLVYAIPDIGGNWTPVGAGTIDRESNGSSVYWNPINKQVGLYGGYGFNQMKSWIFENDGTGWQQRKSNPLIDSTPPKGGNITSANGDGTKLYLFSGQGSYTGNELDGTCTLGSPWATANGRFCWLKDLWELDLTTYKFQNILPVNNASIQYEGALAYHYDKSRFYLFGGYQPTGDYAANQNLANTNKTFLFRRNADSGFVEFKGEGDIPPAMPGTLLNNYTYYDPVGKRMIWARYDGIWAYYPDSTTIPPTLISTVWSTGDTTASITVKPTQTTVYRVTRTIGSSVCRDSITITVRTKLSTPVIHTDSTGLAIIIFRWDPVPGATGYLVSMDRGNTYTNPMSGPQGLVQMITGLLPNQTINIAVKALGPYSCQESDTVQAKATTLNPFGDGIYVPNAFTPNGDGVNDVFLIYGTAIASVRLMIYNQWGSLVYTSTDITKGWDGTYKGGKAPAGIYVYALETNMQDGKRVTKNGSLSLIR